MIPGEVSLRIWGVCLALAACLGAPSAPAAELAGSRLDELPAAAREAFERFARCVETGDRARVLELLQPESRLSAAPLLDSLLASPRSPRSELRLLLAGWESKGDRVEARALLSMRLSAERPPEDGGAAGPGALRARLGWAAHPLRLAWSGEDQALVVEAGEPAAVVAARLNWTLDADAKRLRVESELELAPELAGIDWVSLSLPPGTTRLRLHGPAREAQWLRPGSGEEGEEDGEDGGGRLLLRLQEPADGPLRLNLEHEALIPDSIRAGGDTLYLAHGALIAPWASGRFHLWDLTLDLPEELRGVSLGTATEFEAPAGRRRLRYATTRPVDYPGLAVGRFRVDRRGPLELWRVAEVGGSADVLLGELAELVGFHESRVAPLPYEAFRLVELDMGFAGAVSYASMIVMKTAVMAKAKLRFSILSHEVAHQWWGNAVQGDQHTRWISEGMANALMDLFVASVEGEDAKQDLLDGHRAKTLESLGPGALPLAHVRGRPDDFYERGALFVHALREAVSDETFWKILQAWSAEHSVPAVGTPALRATAERVAGRSLSAVFEPWLGSTALPLLEMSWSADERVVSVVITQEEPHFALEVPVEAMLPGGGSQWTRIAVSGARTETRWELEAPPLALRLDPKEVTARVREAERSAYFIGEAGACLARGERERGLRLLERVEESGAVLPSEALRWRAGALALEGQMELSDAALESELASLRNDQALSARLDRIDALLLAGQAQLGLKLIEELAPQVRDGAALPLRRAFALRLLSREEEAQAAWRKALEERPGNAAALLALGLPGAATEPEPATLLDQEDRRLAGNHPATVRLLVASQDRWGLVLPGSRALLLGQGEKLEAVPEFSPPGLLDAVLVEAETERPLVVALEGGGRRGRLSVIELDARGRGGLLAHHERLAEGAEGILSDGKSVFVAFAAREGGLDWFRFLPELRGAATPGPDDRDGLLSLKVKDDPRFELARQTPAAELIVALADGTFAWFDGRGLLRSEDSVLWEPLEGQAWQAKHLLRAGAGAGVLLSGDRSESPFAEDALPERRLVVVDADRFVERRLPEDALQAVLAPDGSVLVLRGRAGCSATELSVSRLAPPP